MPEEATRTDKSAQDAHDLQESAERSRFSRPIGLLIGVVAAVVFLILIAGAILDWVS